MKKCVFTLLVVIFLISCQENESTVSDFTGNQMVYALLPGSEYNVSGTVTFKEKTNGNTLVYVTLSGTEGEAEHPVHLHLGNIAKADADVYALLNPVIGKKGSSETILINVADETPITYAQLLELEASMKIHLAASGPGRDIVLAGGNIGKAATNPSGRVSFGVCKSE